MMSFINLKTTRRSNRRQEKFIDILPSPEIQANPREYFEQYPETMHKLLRQIFYYSRRKSIFSISQQWLATTCGVTREWINKLLAQLEEDGIIKMWFRFKKKSYYRVSSFFTDKVIASIAHLWRGFSLNLLVSKPALDAVQCKSSHLLIKDIFIINNNSHSRIQEKENNTTKIKNNEFMNKQKSLTHQEWIKNIFSAYRLSREYSEEQDIF